jgi:hypothetical protein
MGLLSWLFPTDEDRLRHARALMAEGRHDKAREHLVRCSLPEAEKLYDECSAAVDKSERAGEKKRNAAQGFHGWKIEVATGSARRKKELEKLVAEELARSGVDLEMPDVDQAAVKVAVERAQRRARLATQTEVGTIRLVPIVDAKRRAQ